MNGSLKKMKRNGQNIVEIIVVHITTILKNMTSLYANINWKYFFVDGCLCQGCNWSLFDSSNFVPVACFTVLDFLFCFGPFPVLVRFIQPSICFCAVSFNESLLVYYLSFCCHAFHAFFDFFLAWAI